MMLAMLTIAGQCVCDAGHLTLAVTHPMRRGQTLCLTPVVEDHTGQLHVTPLVGSRAREGVRAWGIGEG